METRNQNHVLYSRENQILGVSAAQEIRDQLERLVQSSQFRNSKRYPALLRFIVEETVAGRSALLKERTLGVEVFGRPPDYDTNADPVVRVSAGEIRKKLAQYYESPNHAHELRLDLLPGSYVPRFGEMPHAENDQIAVEVALAKDEKTTSTREEKISGSIHSLGRDMFSTTQQIQVFAIIAFLIGALGIALTTRLNSHSSPLWGTVIGSSEPVLIVLGVHSLDPDGKDTSLKSTYRLPREEQTLLASMIRSNMVSVSDTLSYGKVVGFLTQETQSFRTQGASETTLEELRRGPVILIGGFNNIWTMRLTSLLRYRFVSLTGSINGIQDSEDSKVRWELDTSQSVLNYSHDYGIVSYSFDHQIGQYVVIAAGIGRDGTEAAAEFLTDRGYLQSWISRAHLANHANFEVVLSTEVIDGKHGPSQVVASHSWP